jgi:glycosyltransferase involved in cell wall biosynthesis
MTELPFISVIVPAWNSRDHIGRCLPALTAQSYPRNRYEILVVDNGSTDDTAEIARDLGAIVLSEPRTGSYQARNTGLAHARGALIAFTDSDCIPDRSWLAKAAAAAMANPDAGILAGRIDLVHGHSKREKLYCTFERMFSFRQDEDALRGLCATANWVSSKEVLERFGAFDATRKSGADGELARKIHAANLKAVYVPDMIVRHPARSTLGELAQRRRRLTGGRWERTKGVGRTARVFGIIVWDTARRLKAAATARDVAPGDRARVAGIVLALSGVAIAELARLSVGGEAHRA